MSTHKDEKNGTWYVMVRYHDWKGTKRQKCKRGFATRREAQEWERNFRLQTEGDPDMTFEAFLKLYENDMRPRLKENTWLSKEHMIRTKLFPTFGKKMLSEIETRDIIAWQNELLAYRDEKNQPYSPTYLKSIHNQLVAILNHAVRHYRLKSNPASKVGYIGSKEAEEMQFWTKEEYQRFAEAVMDGIHMCSRTDGSAFLQKSDSSHHSECFEGHSPNAPGRNARMCRHRCIGLSFYE